jgi:hypothetical protein
MASRVEAGSLQGRSNTVTVSYDGPERRGRLHILALGVDDYLNRPLKFSATDANALADYLRSHYIDGELEGARIEVLTNTEVTADSVRQALEAIRSEARPEDTVSVFLAGHTDVRLDPGGRDRFCLLLPGFPFDEINPAILGDAGIRVALRGRLRAGPGEPAAADPPGSVLPYSEIERLLVRMDALQRLVILDACQAEAALDDPTARRIRENAAEKVDDDAHRARTTYLLASRRDMPALEADELGHGLLTYVLLRGMGAADLPDLPAAPVADADADLNADDLITTAELSAYADRTLPPLAAHFTGTAPRRGANAPPDRGPVAPPAIADLPAAPVLPASLQAADEDAFPIVRLPEAAR